ncbi:MULTISPECIES: histidinol dehydrogenase [Synechocystis]|uniref:Histidinol dehydrogenase n=1 Tax=Synechocystis salina LEGE 00031 TaxID=1828736 RepID=A0ABR9VUH6_9SYNC|nr:MULTISPECIES: histidinol dehydrogenase [Synechocystis]MBD2652821.1 histidinol dehydrogenase [Synechocystis sp. FACHB-383]MBE9242647.1 histidinol dehydrogenase [Synechocystis salina LEGE 00041]MBE9254108.1 histidinol dehydrogenase [Synechocystis salina LEGE 00031]
MLRLITQSGDIVQELRRLHHRPVLSPWPVMAKVVAAMEHWATVSQDSPPRVSGAELDAAYQRISQEKLLVIRQACNALEQVYRPQLPKAQVSFPEDGTVRGQRFYPVRRAGFYLETKRGDALGNLLRQGILAKTVGVGERVLVTETISPTILVAAQEMGIEEIYLAAGVPAIAMLTWGAKNIAPVESITGAGSPEVMAAKQLVSGVVTIDQTLVRTNLMVLADGEANGQWLALDLLAHAEQYPNASAVLLTDRLELGEEVIQSVNRYCREQEHSVHTEKALAHYGLVAIVEDLEACGNWVNEFSPHILLLAMVDPWTMVEKVQRAREIYIGHHSPSILGHYLSGAARLQTQDGGVASASELAFHCFLRSSQLLDYGNTLPPPWLKDLVNWQGLTAIEERLGQLDRLNED